MARQDQVADEAERPAVLLVGVDSRTAGSIAAALAASDHAGMPIRAVDMPAEVQGARTGQDIRIVVVGTGGDAASALLAVRGVAAALPDAIVFAMGPAIPDALASDLIHAGAEDYLAQDDATIRALPRIFTYTTKRRRVNAQVSRLSAQRAHVEALLSTTFELSATPMALSEEDGTVLVVNGAFTETFGPTARAAAGRRLGRDLFPALAATATDEAAPQILHAEDGRPIVAGVRRATTPMERRNIVAWAFVPQTADDAAAGEKLAALIGEEPRRLAAGRLQLVRIDTVRSHFGDRWARWSARVYEIALRTIRGRLDREDVISRNVQGDFVICFARLDGDSAWFKAQAIQREIERQILGEAADGSMGAVVVETHEIELAPDDAGSGIDVGELIGSKLAQAAERLRADEQGVLAELYGTARLDMRRVETASGEPAPVLVAEFDRHTRAALGRLAQVTADAAQLLANIDMMLLGRVSNAIPNLLTKRPALLMVATIHAATLQSRPTRDRLLAICHQMPESHRRALILRVEGVPPDILPSRAMELLAPLRALSRFRILVLARADTMGLPLRDCGVSLVEVDCGVLVETSEREPARQEKLLADLRRQRTHLVVGHVADRAAAAKAAALGARFLSFDGPPAPAA